MTHPTATYIKRIISDIADLLLPRACPVCGKVLSAHERYVCSGCMLDLPRTLLHEHQFNTMEQLFAGKTPIERATGYFFYEKDNRYAGILHSIKYYNNPKLGQWLAAKFATELLQSGFFDGIDMIIPIPLHRSKLALRGYNQSEYIARGISEATGIPVATDIVKAVKPHATQTRKGIYERYLNTRGIFGISHPERLEGKHILIVDDVVTTGATIMSCAELLNSSIHSITLSAATLAVARLS